MKRTLRILALLCLSAIFLTVSALADSGPKPLLTVRVENAPEEGYYLDLVAEGEYEGHSYGSGESEYSGIDWSYSDEEAAALDTELLDALRTVAEMLADQLANRSGGQYLLFFLLLGVTLVCLIVDARAGRPVFWKGCAAVTAVIVFLALLLMYRPVEGSRHTLVLDVLLLAALLVEDARPAAGTAAAALVLAALGVLNLADGFTMPRYSAEWDAAVQQIEAALTESRSAVTSADPWDSTVAYAFGDPVHCGLLYGVPDGMGIQFDETAYLTDPAHEIHSRYVLTAADTPTAARLQADGWTVLYESDRGVLYERGTM